MTHPEAVEAAKQIERRPRHPAGVGEHQQIISIANAAIDSAIERRVREMGECPQKKYLDPAHNGMVAQGWSAAVAKFREQV